MQPITLKLEMTVRTSLGYSGSDIRMTKEFTLPLGLQPQKGMYLSWDTDDPDRTGGAIIDERDGINVHENGTVIAYTRDDKQVSEGVQSGAIKHADKGAFTRGVVDELIAEGWSIDGERCQRTYAELAQAALSE